MTMNINAVLQWRYSTKSFDSNKKISEEGFEQVKDLLQMSPSSTNIQPWHFIIAHTEAGKKRIAKATQGNYQFNEAKVLNASHVIVFCTRTKIDDAYLNEISAQEKKDGRYPDAEIQKKVYDSRKGFVESNSHDPQELLDWMEKQVYLNMGNLLLGVACMKIDAVPMEGVNCDILDEEFGLKEKGYRAIAAVSLGYRDPSDFNIPSHTPKSRLEQSTIITILD